MHKSLAFILNPAEQEFHEILYAMLDAEGFEGIFEEGDRIIAYIASENYRENFLDELSDTLSALKCQLRWQEEDIPEQNWNALWESNFEPVLIDSRCAIRAPFHPPFPDVRYEITIEPKMSFGTGHHQTTRLVMERMLDMDFQNKKVLDMGCGTGVLSILASMLGAAHITAIDIDSWAWENTRENIERNNCSNILVLKGSVEAIPPQSFDIILANINRNILLEQIPVYAKHACTGSLLLLSGILTEDEEMIRRASEAAGFHYLASESSAKWMAMSFRKN